MKKWVFLAFLFLASCSPFGGQTIIESISDLFQGESNQSVVSGATSEVDTNSSSPAQNYKVSASVGGAFSQPSVKTDGGYTVFTSVK